MAGIYIHIPFCKQACHYCDFHFSTSLNKRDAMLGAICKELILRKEELTQPIGNHLLWRRYSKFVNPSRN